MKMFKFTGKLKIQTVRVLALTLILQSLCLQGAGGSLCFAAGKTVSADNGGAAEETSAKESGAEESTVAGEESQDREIIKIDGVQKLKVFSENAGKETYTGNKTFILTKDLNLNGTKLKPVQDFEGVFDGGGHTIKGFSYKGKQSGTGLFRSIGKTGEVKNLTLECDISPTEDMKNIGGIAGINAGIIRNCSVQGSVFGMEAVGGIAGRNTESGEILNCTNEAEVHGMRRTGGITGFNEGLIRDSENKGEINTGSKTAWEINDERKKQEEEALLESDEEAESDSNENISKFVPDNMDIGYDDVLDMIKDEQEVNFSGGIAGVNSGGIYGCGNHADVGYDHLGYKSGGIAGYDRGMIDSSVNTGNIYGRKNTGGIAGQLEPYIREEFSEDSFSRAQKEADLLVGLITTLQDSLKNEDDTVQERIDNIRGSADRLRGSISSYKDYYRGKDDLMEADMREHTNEIRDIVNDIDVNFKTKSTANAISNIQKDLNDIDKIMNAAEKAAAGGIAVDMTGYIGKVRSIYEDLDDNTDKLLKNAQNAGKEYNELRKSAKRLRDQSNSLDDFLRNAYDSYKTDLRSTDDDLTAQTDTIAEFMDELSDALKHADSVVRSGMDGITSTLVDLNEDINNGFDEARGEIDRLKNYDDVNDIYDDISDNPDPSPARGRITSCRNEGSIITDINGGGIAGMVDTDIDLQSDFKVESEGDYSMQRKRTKLATITECSNYGAVSVKNDCAGGIAGSMDAGAVESCQNFGPVETRDGDYAGGISGKSGFMIRNSFSMAEVSGNCYVGGIAGYGNRIIDNKALTTISAGVKEKSGAIAGDTDEKEKTVSGNIYVENSVGAVNGLTFENEARGVSFEEFINLPGVPEKAKKMSVSFVSDGKVIKTLEVPYGGAVKAEDYPPIENKEDSFGVWEEKDLSDIRQNTVVNAVFISYVTTVASGESFPVLLVSGKFYKDASVQYEKKDGSEAAHGGELPEGYEKLLSSYDFSVISDHSAGEDEVSLRLLADDYGKDDTAAVMNPDGSFTVIDTVRDGRYMVFPYRLDNMGGSFCILKKSPDKRIIGAVIAGACLLLLIILIRLFGKYRKKPGKKK